MLSLKLTGKVPFTEVYCHSLVRDSEGRKMSKSLGNVIDPIDIMEGITLQALNSKLLEGNLDPKELQRATKYQQASFPQGIPECGSDALRFSLIQYTTGGGDIAFDVKVMHAYRRFCNKIYQATKYVLGTFDKFGKDFVPRETAAKTGKETLPERWILSKFNRAAKEVNETLTDREFSRSTQVVYNYFYDELCDVFIENSKAIISDGNPEERKSAMDTLYTALEGALRMIHPFMPFLSEELWQRLPRRPGDKAPSITVAEVRKMRM
jgi:valyl-tRNA synthetase